MACLYELDGDTLKFCEPEQPGDDRPTTLESTGGSKHYLWTLKRSDKPPAAEKPVKSPPKNEQEKEKDGFTAWGKEVGGLQAGLGLGRRSGHYNQGEAVTLVVRVRNVGKEAVKFQYLWAFFVENPPAVTDGEGKRVLGKSNYMGGAQSVPVERELGTGQGNRPLRVESRTQAAGKFQIQYERVFGNSPGGGTN